LYNSTNTSPILINFFLFDQAESGLHFDTKFIRVHYMMCEISVKNFKKFSIRVVSFVTFSIFLKPNRSSTIFSLLIPVAQPLRRSLKKNLAKNNFQPDGYCYFFTVYPVYPTNHRLYGYAYKLHKIGI
jgi:hypothetical protein